MVIVGNQIEVLRQDEAGLAAPEEAVADGLGDMHTGQNAVAAGTVVPVGPPVGQTAHGAVNPGTVHPEAPDVIVDQLGGVFLITGVVIVHGNTFPFVLQAAVPTLAGPFGVVPCNGELRSGAVGNIVKENGHAQTVGFVAVVFAAFFPAVALIDHGLVIGVIDTVFVVVKDRQQPHMVNAHGLQLGEIFGVLIEIILQRKACIHGPGGMAGIHHAVVNALSGGGVAKGGHQIPNLQIGVPVLSGNAGRQVKAAHTAAFLSLEVDLQACVVDVGGAVVVPVNAAAPFFNFVQEKEVHVASG